MKLKAAYTLPELAELTGLSRHQLWRLTVQEGGPQPIRIGRGILIPLTAFASAFPQLWLSVLQARGIAPDSEVECPCCGSTYTLCEATG